MKRILYVADIYPFPYDTGGKLRTANILMQLSKYFDIDFVCFSIDSINDERIKISEKYCKSVKVFYSPKPNTFKKMLNLFTPTCNAAFIVKSKEMNEYIYKLVKRHEYMAIFVERLYAYQYVKQVKEKLFPDVPVYVDMHDIEREAMGYFGKITKNVFRRLHYQVETQKVISLEQKTVQAADYMIAVSERDKDLYSEYFPDTKKKWFSVNNGVDLSKAINEPVVERDSNLVIFMGSLRHPPNLHGLRWFVQTAWPQIIEERPTTKFVIVGSGEITEEDNNLFEKAKGVEFKGYVENLYPLLRKASCLAVPLFSGSGTRLKILEAFSFELPVVSTSVGAEGIPCTDGEEILLADDETHMKDSILKILDDRNFSRYLADQAYKLVSNDYNWEIIVKKLAKKMDGQFAEVEKR